MSTTAMALFLAGFLFALPAFLFGLGRLAGPAITRALAQQPMRRVTLQATQPFDLHGLASVRLPSAFRALGLERADPRRTAEEQLAAHEDLRGLVFAFEADPQDDRQGQALQPFLMNLVLLDPDTAASTVRQAFSIRRYLAPGAAAVPLDDPRWQEVQEDPLSGGRCWRWLSWADPLCPSGPRRWALSLHDPRRAVRIEIFAWQRDYPLASLKALASRTLDSLSVGRARDAYYRRRHLQPRPDSVCP